METDFAKFRRVLPYASALFGIYQPLLGWRSSLQKKSLEKGVARTNGDQIVAALPRYEPRLAIRDVSVSRGEASPRLLSPLLVGDTYIGSKILELVSHSGIGEPDSWKKCTSSKTIDQILRENKAEIAEHAQRLAESAVPDNPELRTAIAAGSLARESQLAGVIADINKSSSGQELMNYFQPITVSAANYPIHLFALGSGDVARAVISPIGVVHLFRQYFFEFDSFLGPSVQHLWLSPGSTVELVESSTRKVIVERSMESLTETTRKDESSSTIEDELSDAVRSENQNDTKVGVSVSSDMAYDLGIIKGSVNPTMSFDIDQTGKTAREQTHRTMRQQTSKISSEIRKSFKSTFKVVTETTDTQSRRYVISNGGNELVNYELRRKMRQVGVQVQDYGAHLCWQAYVDEPGKQLGLSQLVHIAAPEDLQSTPEPEALQMPEPEIRAAPVALLLQWRSPNKRRSGFIPLHPKIMLTPPKPGYIFDRAEVVILSGPSFWNIRAFPQNAGEQSIRFEGKSAPDPAEVDQIETGVPGQTERSVRSVIVGHDAVVPIQDDTPHDWNVQLTIVYRPSRKLLADTQAAYDKKMTDFQSEKARLQKEAYFKAARDRIAEASSVTPRKFEDLRQEERIIVYRSLIRQLLAVAGITNEDSKVRHVFAELVQTMFDVDRMLYFVAPEWWMPKRTSAGGGAGHQALGVPSADAPDFVTQETVSWGGISDRLDNYFITKDSAPAPLGSSLGWILQLDGDNLRNAFINAPWVKAVVPIRPGHEWDALAWLQDSTIEGSDGLEEPYRTDQAGEKEKMLAGLQAYAWKDTFWKNYYSAMADAEDLTVLDALQYMIIRLQESSEKAKSPIPDPDDASHNYLPTDQVFEFGFDPLAGGFKAEGNGDFKIFDQWIEVLPTDQIVPVEVEYDPATGRLK